MSRVSVLLPCRDVAVWLPAAIASLEAQTLRDFDVIAVDDHSTDATARILAEWSSRDSRVTLLSALGEGIIAALNQAAQHASGEFIARMDGDDVAHATRFERQLCLLREHPHIAACGTGVRYFPRHEVRGGALRYETWINALHSPDDVARNIFVECPLAHPTLCIRRAVFEDVGGYCDHGWPEDYDLVLRLWQKGHALANVPEVLLDWRERSDRSSRNDARYTLDAFRRCKVHYLRRTLLPARNGVIVWGAGPVGKAFALELLRNREHVRAFVDIDPCKIGQVVHGIPVVHPDDIGPFRDALCVGAVGQPNARAEIRAALDAAGWDEGADYVAVA